MLSGPALRLVSEFEVLWDHQLSGRLTHELLRGYRARPRRQFVIEEQAEAELQESTPEPLVIPRAIQDEALVALKGSRDSGEGRGLVVLATGLGKTWLAAFYVRDLQARKVLARRVRQCWASLSNACHAHPYELAPTVSELEGWLDVVDELVVAVTASATR